MNYRSSKRQKKINSKHWSRQLKSAQVVELVDEAHEVRVSREAGAESDHAKRVVCWFYDLTERFRQLKSAQVVELVDEAHEVRVSREAGAESDHAKRVVCWFYDLTERFRQLKSAQVVELVDTLS